MPILKVSEKTGHDYTSGILKLTPEQAQQETTFVDGQRVLVVSGNNDLNSTYEFVERLDNAPIQSVEGIIKINNGGFLVQVDAQVPSLPRLSIEYIASTGAGNDQMYIDNATQQLLYVANKKIIELGSTENGEVASNNALITIQVASEDLLPPIEHRAIGECALVGNEHVYVVTNDQTWVKIKNSLYVRISDLENKVIAARSDIDTYSSHIGDYTHTQDITTRLDNIIQELTTIKTSITVLDDKSDSTDVTLAESITAINNNITNINNRIDGIINNDIDHLNTAISNINNLLIDVESGDLLLLKTHIENLQQALDTLKTEEISVIKIKIEQLSNQEGYDDSALQDRITALENNPSFDDTAINNRLTNLENRSDNDTIYNDTELRNRISVLENKTDQDTVYDDTAIKDRLTHLESKKDNDTIYNDQPVIERLNALEQKSSMPTYATDIEFLESNTVFGFVNDDGLGNPVLAYANSGRAFDYISKKKLGIDVGVNAIPKLTLVYKEEGKQDELKSFVPIALSEIQGTTLIPSTSGNIFWGEWLNASNNQGGYIVCVIDGVLMLSQWIGTPASSVEELFTKIAAGGDVSQDVSPVHKLTETLEHIRTITYVNGDSYNIMKQGTYSYRVTNPNTLIQTEFTLDVSYTGLIEQSNITSEGFMAPKILSAVEKIQSTDSKITLQLSGHYFDNTSSSGYSSSYGLRIIKQCYLDFGDNNQTSFKNLSRYHSIRPVDSRNAPDYIKNMAIWAELNSATHLSIDSNTMVLAPIKFNGRFYLMLFKGLPTDNIYTLLERDTFYHDYPSNNKLILSEIPANGEWGYANRNQYDGGTVVMSHGYIDNNKKIRVPFKGSHGIPSVKSSLMQPLATELGSATYLFRNDHNFLKNGIRWTSWRVSYYNDFKAPYPGNDTIWK